MQPFLKIVLVDEENLIKLWLRLVWLQNSCVFETPFYIIYYISSLAIMITFGGKVC